MRPWALLGLILLALFCTACGDEDRAGPTTTGRAPHWPLREHPDGAVQVVLPNARLGAPDPKGGAPRWVVNVLADGTVIMKGHRWILGSEDEAARQASGDGLRAQLTELVQDARKRKMSTFLPVLLHADRKAPWSAIRAVVARLRGGEIGTYLLQWAVRTAAESQARVDGTLGSEAAPTRQPLVIRIVPEKRATRTVVRIFSPAGIHSFGPQTKAYANEKFLGRANAAWEDLERALPALREDHEAVHVEIVDEKADVWLAYVVKAVDLLFGAGFEEVHLPEEGLVMSRPRDEG